MSANERVETRISVKRNVAGQAIGALCGITACMCWSMAMWGPTGVVVLSGMGFTAALPMMFLAICAVIASLRGHGLALVVIFVASFFPVGWILVFKLSHPLLHWIGICNLGYLIAGLLIWGMSNSPGEE